MFTFYFIKQTLFHICAVQFDVDIQSEIVAQQTPNVLKMK